MKSIYIHLLKELEKKKSLALVTIIQTEGSTPQVSGASALFSSEGLVTGTVGGGLLEADAQEKALLALRKACSFVYTFDLSAEISSAEEPICGGEATILVDARPADHIDAFSGISRSLHQRRPGVLTTIIGRSSDGKISIARRWTEMKKGVVFNTEIHNAIPSEELQRFLTAKKPALIKIEGGKFFEGAEENMLFLEPIYPLPHLIIVGAGHIGQAVCHLGSLLDFEVTVVDDRPEFANREKLPEADHILVDDVGKAVKGLPISSDTYIVIVTRGHRDDAEALRNCIDSEAAYIGMIGSPRKTNLMRKNFLHEKWATSEQWDRIHAPIGIDIQSKTVQEIAISIAAQLIQVRREKQGHRPDAPWFGP
jgi:xanthine dehydrogenase accessory factor